ncbi:protein phosphatase methylesterase 1 isoform X2 [Latimeria chalumnae]|uniref:protein phosphatase methylesterase 1 isoform X2 n=1 Tax=Latimeria chalumnae TaxID=7897 RepID=UPI0006D8EB9F|nr:PREDICTED: protein phosphatase methylesterase 1 [Latimeria chalumnae]|eukprot:XP_014348532.1 PREDICTED: protein phosphatase methylesterase 1 [Latimeria chalumnae]
MSALEKHLHLNRLPSRPPMPGGGGLQSGSKMRMGPGRRRDFTPVPWSQYFESMEDVVVDHDTGKDSFRIYTSGSEGPVLLLLHGGGHSALSWAVFTSVIINRIQCRVVAVDLRGHGETKVKNTEDLSAETMSKDVGNIIETLYGENPPPIMLIGHSMGGAIAVHAAGANLVPSLLGLCVIDVVEGTAMDALNSMQNFLRSRPKTFKSLENAIEWSVKSGQIRNLESAKVSMVGQVKMCEDAASPEVSKAIVEGIIEEEDEDEDEEKERESNNKRKKEDDMEVKKDCPYTWRIELSKTEKYWDGWFRGLSSLFLSCSVPKLLLLAGVDRLDKDLTIGQMQGKFQMQVLPQCGHAVHEDAPDKVAEAVATFMVRHRFTESKGGFQCVFPAC